MKLVKHRFEKNGLVADIVWCTEPDDDWLLTIGRVDRVYTDMATLPNEYHEDIWLKDEQEAAIRCDVMQVRKEPYEGLSSGTIAEKKDEACIC